MTPTELKGLCGDDWVKCWVSLESLADEADSPRLAATLRETARCIRRQVTLVSILVEEAKLDEIALDETEARDVLRRAGLT